MIRNNAYCQKLYKIAPNAFYTLDRPLKQSSIDYWDAILTSFRITVLETKRNRQN